MLTNHRNTIRSLVAAAVLALSLGLGGSAFAADAVTAENIAAKIAAAKTPADHEAIAAFYTAQAADAAAKVKEHEAMMSSYKNAGKAGIQLADHCKTLIGMYKEAESHYTKLAAEHTALAKAAAGH